MVAGVLVFSAQSDAACATGFRDDSLVVRLHGGRSGGGGGSVERTASKTDRTRSWSGLGDYQNPDKGFVGPHQTARLGELIARLASLRTP